MIGVDLARALYEFVEVMLQVQCMKCYQWRWAWRRCPCRERTDPS